jgi:[protein-PII] uridylyltransferase
MKSSESAANLIQKIEAELFAIPGWQESHPMALGSWARGELSPRSDLDMLFIGDEKKTAEVVRSFQENGYKIRARTPEDLKDWTKGVQSKDILSLLIFKAFTDRGRELGEEQRQLILRNARLRRGVFFDVLKERRERNRRYDSLNNFLQPNIKQGPGGLRDIDQSLQVLTLLDPLKQLATEEHHARKALEESKQFLLQVREHLHLAGFQDQLIASEQKEIGLKLGFKSQKDFMKKVSQTFSRAHFYSDWIFEYLRVSASRRREVEKYTANRPKDLMLRLRKNSSILTQQWVRSKMDSIHQSKVSEKERGRLLREAVLYRSSDELTKAVFQSQWIRKLCPQIKPLIGYVQHDQYHRLAAEAHLMQAVREVKRVWKSKKKLGRLAWIHQHLSARDWEILSWAALYHDLGKGREGLDGHADLGELWAEKDLLGFGLRPELVNEVAFLVKNHLQLSIAAFRKNPQDSKTWKEFFELGFNSRRVLLLAAFTVIDIRATNPEAWTDWKSNLLSDCVKALENPEKKEFYFFTQSLATQFSKKLGENIDPVLIHYFNKRTIEKDLLSIRSMGLQVRVLRDRQKKVWLRFSTPKDETGLVAKFVRALFMTGVSIQQALIQTLPEVGVYDLFQIGEVKSPTQVLRRVEVGLASASEESPPEVVFRRIEIVSENEDEVVLSFQGTDQRGLLWAVASRLQEHGVSIRSARVHTWGRQIEDLIHVRPRPNLHQIVRSLQDQWLENE